MFQEVFGFRIRLGLKFTGVGEIQQSSGRCCQFFGKAGSIIQHQRKHGNDE